MSKFFPLKITAIKRETPDAVILSLEIPTTLQSDFSYKQGQYLTFKTLINGEEIRRSYSLCSSPYDKNDFRVAVKEVPSGKFSTFINRNLKIGDSLETMPPQGNFFTELLATNQKKYVAFAAGSGITPVFSILKSVLLAEPKSSFTLVYANRNKENVILKSELEELQKAYTNRFTLIHVFSADSTEDPILKGRITASNLPELIKKYNLISADEYFVCGPEELIMAVSNYLIDSGKTKSQVHFELFTTPVKLVNNNEKPIESDFNGSAQVKVIIDGIETEFNLEANGVNILDAAMDAGADAPFSCKGAVCCTCKAKVIEGKASMDMNYSLTDNEVANGFILTCQAHPQSEKLVVDYDVS